MHHQGGLVGQSWQKLWHKQGRSQHALAAGQNARALSALEPLLLLAAVKDSQILQLTLQMASIDWEPALNTEPLPDDGHVL